MLHPVAIAILEDLQQVRLEHQDLEHRFEASPHIPYILFAILELAEPSAKYEDPDTIFSAARAYLGKLCRNAIAYNIPQDNYA